MVSRYARGVSPTTACIAREFARTHLMPVFGGFVYLVDDEDGDLVKQQIRVARAAGDSDGIFASKVPDPDDPEWEFVINEVSWSWKEVLMLMLHANPQLYDNNS